MKIITDTRHWSHKHTTCHFHY